MCLNTYILGYPQSHRVTRKCTRCHGKGKVPGPDSDERHVEYIACPRCSNTRECPQTNTTTRKRELQQKLNSVIKGSIPPLTNDTFRELNPSASCRATESQKHDITCPRCDGDGKGCEIHYGINICSLCNGIGKITQAVYDRIMENWDNGGWEDDGPFGW